MRAIVIAVVTTAILFTAAAPLSGVPLIVPVRAGAPPDVPACEPVGTMGMVTLYRCVDEDYGKVCYLQSISGMVFCLDE